MLTILTKDKIYNHAKKIIKNILYAGVKKQRISIISNNCAGGFLYKKFGCKYMSPTINLQMSPKDYIKFCSNLNHYISQEIEEIKNPDVEAFIALGGETITFPVGKIDDLTIYFQHYKDFACAANKWEERKKRINYNKLYFVLMDTYCDMQDVESFFSLPYKNKIFITGNRDLILNKNCVLINTKGQAWFNSDWMECFNFREWFLKS